MIKRWISVALLSLVLLVIVVTPAIASHGFSVTVAKKADLKASHILLEVSGTYNCGTPTGGLDPNNSGFGFQVSQFHKNGVISGGGGMGGNELNCDGATHSWTQQINGFASGEPALWHGGRAIVQGGGQVCNSDFSDCAGTGFTQSIRISG